MTDVPTRPEAAPNAGETGADERAHVSGIVVHCVADAADAVAGRIDALDGAEVAAREGGKLVVVLEAAEEHALADMVNRISLFDNVHAASLVSHYVDDPAVAPGSSAPPPNEEPDGERR